MLKNKQQSYEKDNNNTFTIISLNAYTQDSLSIEIIGDTRPFTEVFDSLFRNIMYDTLSTKILYSKVIITQFAYKIISIEEAKIATHPLHNKFIQQNKEKIHIKYGSKEKILSLQD